jgi:amylosucrase
MEIAEYPGGRKMKNENEVFEQRLAHHRDELRWLYMELYDNGGMFDELCANMKSYYEARAGWLKKLDEDREQDPGWYRSRDMLGMMLYIDNFSGNLQELREKLPYLESCHVSCLHLMPFLDSPEGRSDGGYAVADFRKVRPDLGTMEDLEVLSEECHRRNISLCMDFVMNHTSEDHEWARRARRGEAEYMGRYFFYDNYDIPAWYESTVPQVFPTTAPGNFTYLPELGQYVMTTFYPYQWDLNYRNPRVFNEMMYNFLYLANHGMDVIRIDAVPYIWKELGTNCRNLKQVHTIVRMMRMISEIVCPAVTLLGEVVMEPEKVVPYFGTVEKPECHMLYNVTTMATIWNTVATRDARLLKKQLDIISGLPNQYTFLNYLRCHDDIGWGLDYATLRTWGMEEVPHKRYLNNYFRGREGAGESRGELYNEDLRTGDARFCGTTASMCGVERAVEEQDDGKLEHAIRMDVMLHAFMMSLSGIPMLYSGDEIGQLNDYTYHQDPAKCEDSRYIHRGKFRWDLAACCTDESTVQGKLFAALQQLRSIRSEQKAFDADAHVWTEDVGDQSVLCVVREKDGQQLVGLFNFSEYDRTVHVCRDKEYRSLTEQAEVDLQTVTILGHDFVWAVTESNN